MKARNKSLTGEQLLEQIILKLDILILLTSLQGRSKEEQVKILVGHGYSNSEIAHMLSTPKGTIDSIRANLKKGGRK